MNESYAVDWIQRIIYSKIFRAVHWMTEEFENSESDLVPVPDAFAKAWLHFLTGIVLISQQPITRNVASPDSALIKHLEATATELNEGMRAISSRLQFASLQDLEICTANSLVALLLSRLSKDIMHGRPRYIQFLKPSPYSRVYWHSPASAVKV